MIENYGQQDLRKLNLKKFNFLKNKKIVTNGEFCKKFEKKILTISKSKYSVVCNNGTSAILMAILALNKKELITIIPNINFVAAASIMTLLKNNFVLCDVNPKTGMVDLENFKKCLEGCKKKNIKPNLFIPVHYAGNILELSEIQKICKKKKIDIIEDGCHSFGSSKKTNTVGNCKNSIMTTFSFHPVKNITTLEGGAITTNNKKIFEKLLDLRSHSLKNTSIEEPYRLVSPSLNFRMSEINAAIGIDQITLLNYFKKKRNNLVKKYIEELSIFKKNFDILNFDNKNFFWHLFVIKLKNKKIKKKLMLFLKKKKIGSQVHYKPLFHHKVFKKNILLNYSKNSSNFYNSQLSLPLHPKMSAKDVKKISNTLNTFFNK